jgi:hypothetical protein
MFKSHGCVPFFFLLIRLEENVLHFTHQCPVSADDTSVHENARFRMTHKREGLRLLPVLGPHDLTAQGDHKRRQHTDDQDDA